MANIKTIKATARAKNKAEQMEAAGINFEDDAHQSTVHTESDLKMVQQLASEMRGIDSRVEYLTKEMTRLSERYQDISMRILPDLMTQIGITDFALGTGERISIKDVVRASIPSQSAIDKADGPERQALIARKENCFAWLRKMDAASLIKTELNAEFGKGQEKAAIKFVNAIRKAGYGAALEQAVNFQTLNKFIRESLQNGTQVPAEDFALFTGKTAVIAKAKSNK